MISAVTRSLSFLCIMNLPHQSIKTLASMPLVWIAPLGQLLFLILCFRDPEPSNLVL